MPSDVSANSGCFVLIYASSIATKFSTISFVGFKRLFRTLLTTSFILSYKRGNRCISCWNTGREKLPNQFLTLHLIYNHSTHIYWWWYNCKPKSLNISFRSVNYYPDHPCLTQINIFWRSKAYFQLHPVSYNMAPSWKPIITQTERNFEHSSKRWI